MKDFPIGTEIYYTGDMANESGFGKVTAHLVYERFPDEIGITLDDGRIFTSYPCGVSKVYNGNCGFRFVTKKARDEYMDKILRGFNYGK